MLRYPNNNSYKFYFLQNNRCLAMLLVESMLISVAIDIISHVLWCWSSRGFAWSIQHLIGFTSNLEETSVCQIIIHFRRLWQLELTMSFEFSNRQIKAFLKCLKMCDQNLILSTCFNGIVIVFTNKTQKLQVIACNYDDLGY